MSRGPAQRPVPVPVAVLHPSGLRRARTRRLLCMWGVPVVEFRQPAQLLQALAAGTPFSLLVLAFGEPLSDARQALLALLKQAGPGMPVMLLMNHAHVDLAACVMQRHGADYVLEPCAQHEKDFRLLVLLARHSGHAVSPDWFPGLPGLQA